MHKPEFHLWPRLRTASATAIVALVALLAVAAPALAVLLDQDARTMTVSTGTLLPPTNVAVTNPCLLGIQNVTVSWTATTDGLSTSYELERTPVFTGGNKSLAVTDTSYVDSAVNASTTYTYRLRSIRGSWTSPWSTSATIRTKSLLCL